MSDSGEMIEVKLIYVVTRNSYSDDAEIVCAFSDEEEADEYCQTRDDDYVYSYKECSLDEPLG